jgi:hypothetical protein
MDTDLKDIIRANGLWEQFLEWGGANWKDRRNYWLNAIQADELAELFIDELC